MKVVEWEQEENERPLMSDIRLELIRIASSGAMVFEVRHAGVVGHATFKDGKLRISKSFQEYLKEMNNRAFEVAAYVLDKRNKRCGDE